MLDHTLAREATYSRSFQTTTEAENVFRKSLELNTVDGEIPSFIREKAKQHMSNFNMRIKTSVKNATRYVIQEKLKNHVQTLQVQGPLLSLAIQEKEDLLWEKKVCSN